MLTFRPLEKPPWPTDKANVDESAIHIWGVSLEAEADTIEQCWHCLSPEESMRAARITSEQQRRHFVAAHGALRMVLSRYCDCGPKDLSFQKMASGKPVLQGTDERTNMIRFNLSHSRGRALIAVSKEREVGVDLEKVLIDRDVTALAARFFAPQEQVAIGRAAPTAKHVTFSRIWVAKEAVLKARGSGLTFPLDRHRIELSCGGTTGHLVSEGNPPENTPLAIQFLSLEAGWVGAVAAEGSGWKVTLCT